MIELCNGLFACRPAPLWFYAFAGVATVGPMAWLVWDAYRRGERQQPKPSNNKGSY